MLIVDLHGIFRLFLLNTSTLYTRNLIKTGLRKDKAIGKTGSRAEGKAISKAGGPALYAPARFFVPAS